MNCYETLTQAISCLKREGFIYEFCLTQNGIECRELDIIFKPEDLTIREFYRFEGWPGPGYNEILYALESKTGIKGTLMMEYGAYAIPKVGSILSKIPIRKELQCA